MLASLLPVCRAQDEQPAPPPGFLGVATEASPLPTAEGEPARAAIRVTSVVPRSPAARAGLEPGDVILAVDGEPVAASPEEVTGSFGARIRARGAGAEVRLTVRRPAVSVQTALDEEPSGPPRDASGPGIPQVLPDLARLLEEHPERLVTVRARRFAAEREVAVTLSARPGSAAVELPANATLWPDLEAEPLDAAAHLAEQLATRARVGEAQVATRYTELLQRFERDEALDDPYRLKTVRYLHRAPLRLGQATRALAGLRQTFVAPSGDATRAGGLPALTERARFYLDAAPAAGEAPPRPPGPGSSPEAHGRFALGCVELAERRVARALSGLEPEERAFLGEHLPVLAERFAAHIYLHSDEDPQRRGRHERAIELLTKVDRGGLLDALEALSALADPSYLAQLEGDLLAAETQGRLVPDSMGGVTGPLLYKSNDAGVVVGGSGGNEYRRDLRVVIDLGGDDRYHAGELASGRPDRPAAVVIDLAGDDRYQSTTSFAQGSGFLGVGLLVDVSGRDHYTSNQPFSQGAALAGAGLLLDLAGDDVYRGPSYTQGAALIQGLGALVDMGGDDLHLAGLYAQGFAGPGSMGLLLAQGGNDRYAALGLAPCSYGDAGTFRGMSQGSAIGFRHLASAGIAALLDEGGEDVYEAGNFSQGGGYYFGWGTLIDLGGDDDRYEGSRYAQAFAAHSALGSFWEDGGDDVYRGWVGAQNGAAWDLSVTSFHDAGGDDVYQPGRGFSLGASAHNGLAVFVDGGGSDRYRIAPGRAGPNDYHGGPSLSVFVDAGGSPDVYEGGGLADDRLVTQPEAGVLVDLAVPVEDVTPEVLERLLGR